MTIVCDGRSGFWSRAATAALALLAACRLAERAPQPLRTDTVVAVVPPRDSVLLASGHRPARLSRAADSLRRYLVFAPLVDRWFLAAAPNGQLVVDLGRVDLDLRRAPHLWPAFREAAAARSPIALGSSVLTRAPGRSFLATLDGFTEHQGRVVGILRFEERIDTLSPHFVASVERSPGAPEARPDTCNRSGTAELLERAVGVADSLLATLRSSPDARRVPGAVARRSHVVGCFAGGYAVVAASLSSRDVTWGREVVVLIRFDGSVQPLPVEDFRFRVHELLAAFDSDGDGSDDVVARAWTERAGGTVVLRLVEGARLERLAAGFAWEEWR